MIPEKIKVGGMMYETRIIPNLYKDRSIFGEVTYSDQIIKIAGDVSEQRQFNTFIHELTHAILFEAGDMSDQDEAYVRRFSNLLTQLMIDNKWSMGNEKSHNLKSLNKEAG